MAGFFDTKRNRAQRELRRRFGFVEVKSALNAEGEEIFGLIEVAPEYGAELFPVLGHKAKGKLGCFTAALRLTGPELNLFLQDDKQEQSFWSEFCRALPTDSPSQLLLRRRRGELGDHYQIWQEKIQQRLADPEVSFFFLQDYLDNLIYPTEEAGLTNLWAGVFISGRNQEELSHRLANLMSGLPCETTLCSAEELSLLLLDYYAPALAEEVVLQGERNDSLFVSWLGETNLEVAEQGIYNGATLSFWTLAAPPPQVEGGWTRSLLESENLAEAEFDLVVHLAPAPTDARLYEVLTRRLTLLEETINRARQARQKSAVRELAGEYREIELRLNALTDKSECYYEVGISLALRILPNENEETDEAEEIAFFEEELTQLGLAPRLVSGLEKVEQALLDCAPLNLARLPRGFILPLQTAGRLAQVTGEGEAGLNSHLPLVGLTPSGQPFFLDPAEQPGESTLFFVGNPGKRSAIPARALTQYLAAMRFLAGNVIFGLDPLRQWSDAVRQMGGTYVAIGSELPSTFGWNPLQVRPAELNNLAMLEGWINRTAEYLNLLLELNPVEKQNLKPLLLECAIDAVRLNQILDATLLYQHAEAGGYRLLTEKLAEITSGGRYHWLFAASTKLPAPGAIKELLFIGFSLNALEELKTETRCFYLGQFFAAWAKELTNIPRYLVQPLLLVMDEAQEFLKQPEVAATLLWLQQNAARLGVSLWTLSPGCEEWLLSACGQKLLDNATWHFFFNQNGAGLVGATRRLTLPQRTLKAIRELEPGALLLHHTSSGALTELLPLPGDYVSRLIPTRTARQIAAPAPTKPTTSIPNSTKATTFAESPKTNPRSLVPEPVFTDEMEEETENPSAVATDKPSENEPIYLFTTARGA